jgi:tripartite-type tricarboxylate transporter receptor subunit TctC
LSGGWKQGQGKNYVRLFGGLHVESRVHSDIAFWRELQLRSLRDPAKKLQHSRFGDDRFFGKQKSRIRGRTAMQRSVLLGLTLVLSTVAAMPQGRAEDFPSRPLRLIIGFPPGSAADITARLVGDGMSQTLHQQVVVESRPGAGSSIAAELVVRAPADGYTLYIGTSSNLTNAAISSNAHFDFGRDFTPITPLTGLPLILAVHPSLGVSSVQELIALARSKPGELTYASVGVGTVPHLSTELLCQRANIKLVHVPYPDRCRLRPALSSSTRRNRCSMRMRS